MNNEILKKALIRGIPAAIAVWFVYGVISSFFDDTVFEQMFESKGILIAIIAAMAAVAFFFFRITKKESPNSEK